MPMHAMPRFVETVLVKTVNFSAQLEAGSRKQQRGWWYFNEAHLQSPVMLAEQQRSRYFEGYVEGGTKPGPDGTTFDETY